MRLAPEEMSQIVPDQFLKINQRELQQLRRRVWVERVAWHAPHRRQQQLLLALQAGGQPQGGTHGGWGQGRTACMRRTTTRR